jgi:hypothetical protein
MLTQNRKLLVNGHGIRGIPTDTECTILQAADVLNVSPPRRNWL